MNSQEIKELRGACADNKSEHNALWEIALQLARFNEHHHRLADPELGESGADCERGELWPKIVPYGANWALWMYPLADPKFFDTEEQAKEYLRDMAQRMNDYAPPLKNAKHPYTSTACQHALHERCRKNCKFCASPCMCACHKNDKNKLDTTEAGKAGTVASAAAENCLHVTEVMGGACVKCGMLWVDWNQQSPSSRVSEPFSEVGSTPQKDVLFRELFEAVKQVVSTDPSSDWVGEFKRLTRAVKALECQQA